MEQQKDQVHLAVPGGEAKSLHTPGPWRVDGDDIIERTGYLGGVYIGVPESAGGGRLAQTFANCLVTTDEECRANARLIAAAPELLEALRNLITCDDYLREHGAISYAAGSPVARHWKAARAAFAKASA